MDPDTYYTCSMDVQVIERHPGKCPICHMEMTPMKRSQADKEGQVRLSAEPFTASSVAPKKDARTLPEVAKHADAAVAEVADDNLRDALKGLGEQVLGKKRR